MPLKNLFLVIVITIILASLFYANLDGFIPFLQKITGYTSIVIYGTVVSPSSDTPTTQEQSSSTLTATVTQPPQEEVVHPTATAQPTISKTIEPQEQKQYVNQTILLQVINQTETLKVKLDKLRTSSRDVLGYYSSINDTKNAEKWVNVVVLFNQALDDLGNIQTYTENVKDSATKENVNTMKGMIGDVLKTLDKIRRLIKDE